MVKSKPEISGGFEQSLPLPRPIINDTSFIDRYLASALRICFTFSAYTVIKENESLEVLVFCRQRPMEIN